MKWTENQTCEFVKLYLSHECLWSPGHPSYKQKDLRTKAYRSIIADFRNVADIVLTEAELRIKIKSLRSTYTQELSKIILRSTPDSPFVSSMRWFADWHKCFRNMTRKKIDDNVMYDPEHTTDDSCQKVWNVDDDNINNDIHTDPFTTSDNDYVYIVKPEPQESNHAKQNVHKIKKKKFRDRSSIIDYSDRPYRSSIDSNSESGYKEDEFDIYGKYIASQLRKMDLQKALRLQLEIQCLVSEARISDLSSQ